MNRIESRMETLRRLEHWHRQTGNPLYAWEAIARCLCADKAPTIPEWCWRYLRSAALNLLSLSWGNDFRSRRRVTDDQAIELVAAALLLTRQGKRNAFAQLLKDRDDSQDANTVTWFGDGRLKEIMARRNVSEDRAQRIIRRGKQLVGATKSNPMEDD